MRTPAWPGGVPRHRALWGGVHRCPTGRSQRAHLTPTASALVLAAVWSCALGQCSRGPVLPLRRRPSLSGDRLRHPPLNGGWGWNPPRIFSCASGRGGPEPSLQVSVRGAACAVAHSPTSCSRRRARHRCDACPPHPHRTPSPSASVRRFARVAATLLDTLASRRLPNSLPNAFPPCSPLLPPCLSPLTPFTSPVAQRCPPLFRWSPICPPPPSHHHPLHHGRPAAAAMPRLPDAPAAAVGTAAGGCDDAVASRHGPACGGGARSGRGTCRGGWPVGGGRWRRRGWGGGRRRRATTQPQRMDRSGGTVGGRGGGGGERGGDDTRPLAERLEMVRSRGLVLNDAAAGGGMWSESETMSGWGERGGEKCEAGSMPRSPQSSVGGDGWWTTRPVGT